MRIFATILEWIGGASVLAFATLLIFVFRANWRSRGDHLGREDGSYRVSDGDVAPFHEVD